jgi:hypothetical protein
MTSNPQNLPSSAAKEAVRRAIAEASSFDSLTRAASVRALAQSDALQTAMRPIESMRRQLEALDPTRGLMDALASTGLLTAGPNAPGLKVMSVVEQIQRKSDLMARVANDSLGLSARVIAQSKELERILAPSKLASVHLEELVGGAAFRLAAAQAARWQAPFEELTRFVDRFKEPLGDAAVRSLFESAARVSKGAGLARLVEEAAEAERSPEVQDRAVDVLHEVAARAEAELTLQGAVDQFVLAIEQTKEPLLQKLLTVWLVPFIYLLLGMVLNPVGDYYVKKHLEASSPQEATKVVKEAAIAEVGDVRLLSDYRFVTAKQLRATVTPKARAPVIGQLRFSQVVRVVEKERDFTLVAWKSEDGKVELQAWVFSRYLARFE